MRPAPPRRLAAMLLAGSFALTASGQPVIDTDRGDAKFESFVEQFFEGFLPLSPVRATLLGEHRFDGELDQVGTEARVAEREFYDFMLSQSRKIPPERLSREKQVDARMLRQHIEEAIWKLDQLEEWRWNPLRYAELAGSAIHGLIDREHGTAAERLAHVASRLDQLPRFFQQVRDTLEPRGVPRAHAETAAAQNHGLLALLDEQVRPQLEQLRGAERERLERALRKGRAAIEAHQGWLDSVLVSGARGDFRLGEALYERKLKFALHTPLHRLEIRARAMREFSRVREEMYLVARQAQGQSETIATDAVPEERKAAVIRAALELAAARVPARDAIVDTVRRQLEQATAFVRERGLMTLPDDPVEVIVMPEFRRGVTVAYCDSPGPLEVGQKTFYAVAPLPADWSDEQVASFLREYNLLSLQDLTIHEVMPGHFVQMAQANRHPSKLRSVLASEPFVEGWAVYAERMMIEAGYLADEPLMRLVNLKWYLRAVTNAILDQAVHVEGMSREEAMRLMVDGAFQEEREAAGKWTRAQLTSGQLSTYFVGYQEHADLRREAERLWGERFTPREYHDRLLAVGAPPVQFARALLLDRPLPD